MGSPGFEIHGWGGSDDAREDDSEVAAVRAVGERVGSEIDLLCDPACEYETFADALAVATACDERGSVWYEDPYPDGGISQHAHGTPIRIVGETRRCSTPNRTRWSHAATARFRASQKTDVGLRTGITRGARPCSCLAPRYSPYGTRKPFVRLDKFIIGANVPRVSARRLSERGTPPPSVGRGFFRPFVNPRDRPQRRRRRPRHRWEYGDRPRVALGFGSARATVRNEAGILSVPEAVREYDVVDVWIVGDCEPRGDPDPEDDARDEFGGARTDPRRERRRRRHGLRGHRGGDDRVGGRGCDRRHQLDRFEPAQHAQVASDTTKGAIRMLVGAAGFWDPGDGLPVNAVAPGQIATAFVGGSAAETRERGENDERIEPVPLRRPGPRRRRRRPPLARERGRRVRHRRAPVRRRGPNVLQQLTRLIVFAIL